MFDFHMHSIVSFDGQDTPEAMLRAAKLAGLREICFTDHVDDTCAGIEPTQRFSPESYMAGYEGLRDEDVKLRFGMEFGLLPDNQASFKEVLSWRNFDFVLGSVHYADGEDVYYAPYWNGKTVFEAERRYFEETLLCVKNHDDFDVLAHLTYISKPRIHPNHIPVKLAEHRELIEEILKVLVAKGKGLEINTSGMDRCGVFLPDMEILRRFKDLGGEIVTVGSDAHQSARVGQYTQDAVKLARELFGHVCTYENRKPIFHK